MTKKLLALALVVIMCFSLVACGGEEVKTVEITEENWNQYFELVREKEVVRNSFDEIYDVKESLVFKLKDEYKLPDEQEELVEIALEYKYDEVGYEVVNFNKDTWEFELGEIRDSSTTYGKTAMQTVILGDQAVSLTDEGSNTFGPGQVLVGYACYENPEVLRIKGTLSYVEVE